VMALTIVLGSGVGVRVEAVVLQGNHKRGSGSTITTGTAMMPGGTGYAIKVRAEGVTIITKEAETGGMAGDLYPKPPYGASIKCMNTRTPEHLLLGYIG
jgi:hypothetical protein